MRILKSIHKAEYSPISDLKTYRALPTRSVDYIDPFLFLNHHGPQVYEAHNDGLPFGPHPHRGMETVTFILDGDIAHKDNSGHESVISAGGIQWMTAGSGLVHSETSSETFMENGGPLEILQLWLNLPARLKMTKPFYKGLQKADIPSLSFDGGKVVVNLISGDWHGETAPFGSLSNVSLRTIYFQTGGKLKLTVPAFENIFFYVVKGKIVVNGNAVSAFHLAEFEYGSDLLDLSTEEDSILLLGHAEPFNEPVVASGPFVMNTQQEITQAYEDFRNGKFGGWH